MKYILITGACGGIGFTLAEYLMQKGYCIWAVDLDTEMLNLKYDKYGNKVRKYACDLTSEDAVDQMIKDVVNQTGALDGLVHCAGFDKLTPLFLLKKRDVEALMSIHVYAALELCKMLAKKGNANVGCAIVLISSLAAHEGAKGHVAYAAAKGALEGLLAPAAAELVEKKIRINEVVLGAINTQMTMGYVSKMDDKQRFDFIADYPLGFGQPKDVIGLIAFLLGNEASWITGQKFVIDGGRSIGK